MLDVREAVKTAFGFLDQVYAGKELPEPRLEEVELTEDGNWWRVTVSFLVERTPANSANAIVQGPFERTYKVIEVNAVTGHIRSMKIRVPA